MLQPDGKVYSIFNRGFPKIAIESEFCWFILKKKVILPFDYLIKFIVQGISEKKKALRILKVGYFRKKLLLSKKQFFHSFHGYPVRPNADRVFLVK